MASGDNPDVIEVVQTSIAVAGPSSGDRAAEFDSDEDQEDHKSAVDDRFVPPGNSAVHHVDAGRSTPFTSAKNKNEKEKKIGHRRVGIGGEITYKKIQTTQIMGSIQLGIQHAIGGLASKPERDLLMQDFMTVETTNFPSEGSNHTPAHHFSEFRFKNYAPMAFRYFRDLFGIQPDDYLMSMCSASLRELSNPGASGSIFYLTDDDEFIIKTVQHKEGEFLQTLLPGYYMNLNQNPRTLLPKFFGLYCYQCNSKNVRLVAMNNLLPSSVKLHQKYDLKGSTYKRKASKSEKSKRSPTYKDLDFLDHHAEGIFLESDTYNALIKTIQRDCRVLESFKIMDYSLLLGIHNLDQAAKENVEQISDSNVEDGSDIGPDVGGFTLVAKEIEDRVGAAAILNRSRSMNRHRLVAHSTALESIQADSEPIDQEDNVPQGGIPARNARGERLLLFIGIIDILQSYRLKKKLEHTLKSMIHDGDTVSVHRPGFYAKRFETFMAKKVFKKIPSLDLPGIKGHHRKFRNLVTSYIALKNSPSKKKSLPKAVKYIQANSGQAGPQIQTNRTDHGKNDHASVTVMSAPEATSTPVNVPSGSLTFPCSGQVLDDSRSVNTMRANSRSTGWKLGAQYPAVLEGIKKSSSTLPSNPDSTVCGRIPPPVPPRSSVIKQRTQTSQVNAATSFYSVPLQSDDMTQLRDPEVRCARHHESHRREEPGENRPQGSHISPVLTAKLCSLCSSEKSPSHPGSGEKDCNDTVSISDIHLEDHRSSCSGSGDTFPTRLSTSVESCSMSHEGSGCTWTPPTRNAEGSTPTWTEGTPSFTESSSSGDAGETGTAR